MRAKRVLVSASKLPDLFKDRGYTKVITPLPEDAKLIRFDYDNRMDCFVLIFESEEWEEVIQGAALSDFSVEFKVFDTTALEETYGKYKRGSQ